VRTRAIQLLATRKEPAASKAVLDSLDDPDDGVQRAALAAIAAARPSGGIAAVTRLLDDAKDWAARVRAAETLGALGAGSHDRKGAEALERAATHDDTALVREAALRALAKVDPGAARRVAAKVATSDPEPRVRETAKTLEASR
jgi:HEAT repeat protein